jgi:hypothetical protein
LQALEDPFILPPAILGFLGAGTTAISRHAFFLGRH